MITVLITIDNRYPARQTCAVESERFYFGYKALRGFAPLNSGTQRRSAQARLYSIDQTGERAVNVHTRGLEGRALRGIRAVAAVDQRAGVAHGDALGSAAAGDQCEYRLGETLRGQGPREFLLVGAADLADDEQCLRLRVGRIEGHEIREARAFHRVATHAYPHRGANIALREAIAGFVRQRP